jgi:carbonic anhydrase/acetyltransferase-like protein (isoleucine patch superfamily)
MSLEEEEPAMRIEHRGQHPRIHPSAYVAPTATISGDVTIGPESRILFGAILTAEGGPITVGAHCIVMENAVIRSSAAHPVVIGDHVLVGPRAYLTGCTVEDNVFLAAGSTVFNGARIGAGAEVRINGVVHLLTVVPPDATVPIGWVAVGDPATILSPAEHERIWAIQQPLNFPRAVFGLERPPAGESLMPELTRRYARALARHRDDRVIDEEDLRVI